MKKNKAPKGKIKMKKIILSTETTCDIDPKELDKMGVHHLSLTYRNETTGEENLNLEIKEFYDAIRNGSTFKTSLINEYEFEELFKELVKDGDVLHLGFDGSVSGTCGCAINAAKKVNETSKNKVYVVDSLTGAGGQAILLREVLKKVDEGKNITELVEFANDLKQRISLNFSPEDMNTLAKSGRLNKVVARLGGLLNIKPIIYLNEEGNFHLRQMLLGRKKVLNKMVESFKQNYNFESDYVYVQHGDKIEDAQFIVNEIKKDEKYQNLNFVIDYLGVIVGAHGGPGNICLSYTSNKR